MGWLPKNSSSSKLRWEPVCRDRKVPHRSWKTGLTGAGKPNTSGGGDQNAPHQAKVAIAPQRLRRAAIIMPVYNEQACISETFDAVLKYCQSHLDCGFIFVNDGSSDRTQQILEQRLTDSQTQQIQLLSYRDRGGKGHAVKKGVCLADADYACFLDGDLAYSLEHLDLLLAKLAHHDVVIGCRSLVPADYQRLTLSRKIAGKVFNILSQKILNLPFVDMQAGLKGFRAKAAKELFDKQELMGFSFDVELIYLASKLGYSIAEIPACVSSSHATKISKVNLLVDSIKMLGDLFKIRWNDWLGRYE